MVDMGRAAMTREEIGVSRVLRRYQAPPLEMETALSRFTVLPSNVNALEASLLFSHAFSPFLAIAGPSGWGKSLLLRVASEQFTKERGWRLPIWSSSHFLSGGDRWDRPEPLVLDDAQVCLAKSRDRQRLRHLLELRVRLNRPTFIAATSERGVRAVEPYLPSLQRWVALDLPKPQRQERQVLVRHMAEREGVLLSDRLADLLARRISDSGGCMLGAVQRLGLVQRDWSGLDQELRALALTRMHFGSDFDLRRWIYQSVRETVEPLALQICPEVERSLSIFLMRKVCDLPEGEVAEYFEMEPGDVFSHTIAFQLALSDPRVERLSQIVMGALDDALDRL